jgi:transposase-like protein
MLGQKVRPCICLRAPTQDTDDDTWHFDEVVISIGGQKHWLWRAVDQDGYVLDEIAQKRRNTKAAAN